MLRTNAAARTISRIARTSVTLLTLSCLVACLSSADGDVLKKDVAALKTKLSASRSRAATERRKLQRVMEQATALLTRNNADVGAQVDRLQSQISKIAGSIEGTSKLLGELTKRFNDFQAKVDVKLEGLSSGAPTVKQPPVPEDKAKLFALAKSKLASGEQKEGRRLLRHFIARFPKDAKSAQAVLLIGRSYYQQGKFANAVQEYRKIIEQYKRSRAVPEALFRIGMSFYQLKYCSDAQIFLLELSKKHRRNHRNKEARKVLRLIKRFRKNRKICLS